MLTIRFATILISAVALLTACGDATAPVPLANPVVRLTSDHDDYIGQGQRYLYTSFDADIAIEATAGRLDIHIRGLQSWDASFMAPTSRDRIRPGLYTGLGRFDANTGGMEWVGQSRACNVLTGWFRVDGVDYDADTLAAIRVQFEQHCESGAPALHGSITAGRRSVLHVIG